MLAFKPAQKPLLQRIIGNTFFQISVLVAIVVTVFSIARQQRRRELAERVAEIENARSTQILSSRASRSGQSEMSSTAAPSKAAPPASPPPPRPVAPPPQPAAPATRPSAPEAVGFVPPSTAEEAAKNTAGQRPPRPASNIYVTFAEAPRSATNAFVNAAEPGSGILQGPFLSGVVPGLSAKIRALQANGQFESLDSGSRSIKTAQTVEFYGGQRDNSTGQFLGFVVEVIPTQLDENESHLQLRVWRSLREMNGQIDEVSIPVPDSFTVSSGAGVFISGQQLLPRRSLSDPERRFYDPIKVLHVMTSEEFRQGLSDLVILIEPK